MSKTRSTEPLSNSKSEVDRLLSLLEEAEATLKAMRGEADAVAVDVSEDRQSFTLQSAHQPYRLLAEHMYEGAASMTGNGNIAFCNERLAVMVGQPTKKLLGSPITDLIFSDDRRHFEQLLKRGFAGGARGEVRFQHVDGSFVPVLASLNRISCESGDALCMVATDLSEFKLAESEKHKAQEQARNLAAIVESSDDAILSKTLDGIITSWNHGAEKLYGYTAAEAVGQPMTLIVPPERRAELGDLLKRIGEGKGIDHYEMVRMRKDGTQVFVSATISPVRNAEGKIIGASAIGRDITERKRAEEEVRNLNRELEKRVQQRTADLRESEQQVRRKLDSILLPEGDLGALKLADILNVPGVQLLIEDFHKVVRLPIAIIGPKGEVVVGVGWRDVCTKFHRNQPDACQNCIESDTQHSVGVKAGEFKLYKCKNNLWDAVTPILMGGQHVGNLFVGQFFLNEDPVDVKVFRAQATKFGFDEKEYLSAVDCVPRVSRESVHHNMGFLAKLGQVLSQLSYSTIKLARSKEEVTRVNADLAASMKELEAFTYSVSHDLRAPLRHISGFSKILSQELGPSLPEDAQQHLQRIEEGTRRMGQLVDDLLNLARVGCLELNLQVTSLRTVIDEVIAELRPDLEDRQIEWRIGSLPFVECDPGLLKQVFQNLISNAVKFTRPRAQAVIEIGQEQKDGVAAIYVRDNGVGFSMKYSAKLFGVFQRLHRVEDFGGTGVGLATVQRIIQKHHGRVWAQAELDKGAAFFFTLGDLDATEYKIGGLRSETMTDQKMGCGRQ